MNYLTKKLGMCIIYSVGYTPCASIAQSVEHFTRNEGVEGSSPFFGLLLSPGTVRFPGFVLFSVFSSFLIKSTMLLSSMMLPYLCFLLSFLD